MKNFLSGFLSLYVYDELSIKLEELNCDQYIFLRICGRNFSAGKGNNSMCDSFVKTVERCILFKT